MQKVKDIAYSILVIGFLLFAGSGMLEGCMLALLERLGL